MKVVQLVMSRQFRGAEIFASNLAKELKEHGVDVLYLSLYQNRGSQQFMPEGISVQDLAADKTKSLSFGLIKRLAGALRKFNPDIVQANAGDTLKYAVIAKLVFGLKYKIVFRNASTVSHYFRSSVQKIFYSWLYRSVDKVISVSQASMKDFVQVFPSMAGIIEVIPNSLLPKPFSKLNIFNHSDFNIVHVAGFTFEKNHEGLLRIFKMVKQSIPSAKLWLIGDGPLKPAVLKRVSEMKLMDVVFVGVVTNPMDYIASAHVLVLPSVLEGLPGVILEAFFCRTPVVAYHVGGIAEVVKPGETGWLVETGDEENFSKAVIEISKSTHLTQMLQRASELITNEYDNRKIAKGFLDVYSKLL